MRNAGFFFVFFLHRISDLSDLMLIWNAVLKNLGV